jgi:fused signal recognition particle receptor
VLLACADTFRAAAAQQLQQWGSRIGVEVIAQQPGGDPAAVVFDAIQAARARGVDVVIADTAGRLHTQRNLMEELRKVARVSERALGRPADEALLVLDATVGQNALTQAEQFAQSVPLTGIVLTKLDGTARGGAIVTIACETNLPIKLIGVGEQPGDLRDFDARAFVEELFATE